MGKLIIFVCTANICRSSMAEGIARVLAKAHEGLIFSSMGIQALEENLADPKAIEVCAEIGVDITSHRARQLVVKELLSAEHIFCMDQVHLEFVQSLAPSMDECSSLLTDFPTPRLFKKEIADPHGYSVRHFRRCRNRLTKEIERILTALS